MSGIHIILEGEGAWPDLSQKEVIHLTNEWQISCLPHGMASGKPSVAIRLDLPDGKVVLAETSLKMLVAATRVFTTKFGDPTEEADPENATCPYCGHLGAETDVKPIRPGWISIGFRCPECKLVWGHEEPPA